MELYKIVDTLLKNGNCYVNKPPKEGLENLSWLCGFKVGIRDTKHMADGYVLTGADYNSKKANSITEDLRSFGFKITSIDGCTYTYLKDLETRGLKIRLELTVDKKYRLMLPDFRKLMINDKRSVGLFNRLFTNYEGYKKQVKMMSFILKQVDETQLKKILEAHGYKPQFVEEE